MKFEVFSSRLRVHMHQRRASAMRARAMAKPFSNGKNNRLLLVTQPDRIPQSQIYPFHYYSKDLQHMYNTEVREANAESVLSGNPILAYNATVVAFQAPFDISNDDLYQLIQRLREINPGAKIVYLDWSSPLDLRNAEKMDPLIDLYIKKHVFRDRSRYGKSTWGDTNLVDYYSRRAGLSEPVVQYTIPKNFLNKLIIGPSFVTAAGIMPEILRKRPVMSNRIVDIHARFAVEGTPWYRAMRRDAKAILNSIKDLNVAHEGTVPKHKFLTEMRQSKLCFSPFGYGEVCWRDYEAIMTGTVMIKPDMSHVETYPDIFVPWETYVPLCWDLSDFEDTVRKLCSDLSLRERIANQAYDVLQDWIRSDNFVRKLSPIFRFD